MTQKLKKHSKKRNVGLIYEFLIRYISKYLVENDDKKAATTLNILKQRYRKGSELHREFRLFNALISSNASSVGVASTILREAKKAVIEHDYSRLDKEKSLLIRDINHGLNDPEFYRQSIPEYKMYATVQTLMNDWRSPSMSNMVRVAEYEDKVVRWLTREQPERQDESRFENVDSFVVKLMTERLNRKYNDTLNEKQNEIIRLYALTGGHAGDDSNTLSARLHEIRDRSIELIEKYTAAHPKEMYVNEKLTSIRDRLTSIDLENLTDTGISTFLTLVSLNEEFMSGDENVAK
jgi:hypothetical protein